MLCGNTFLFERRFRVMKFIDSIYTSFMKRSYAIPLSVRKFHNMVNIQFIASMNIYNIRTSKRHFQIYQVYYIYIYLEYVYIFMKKWHVYLTRYLIACSNCIIAKNLYLIYSWLRRNLLHNNPIKLYSFLCIYHCFVLKNHWLVLIDKYNFRRKDDLKLFLYVDKWRTKQTYIYNDKQVNSRQAYELSDLTPNKHISNMFIEPL